MQRLRALSICCGLVACAAVAAAAEPAAWLPGERITSALAGKTIAGRYANGRAFSETYRADGRIEYVENGRTSGGRWSVKSGLYGFLGQGN